jgi:protein-tyrosine-phosphatase
MAVHIAKEFELDLERHRSKVFTSCNMHNADLILPMEFRQYLRLLSIFPEKRQNIRLLRDFAPWPDRVFCNIDDPYGTGENEFRRCFRLLQRAINGLRHYLPTEEVDKPDRHCQNRIK